MFLLLLWAQLWRALIPSWQHGIYYDYGWLVPPAAIFLFLRRFRMLAATGKLQEKRITGPGDRSRNATIALWVGLGIAGFVAVGAARSVEWAAPTWRLPLWIHALAVSIGFHAILASVYGRRVSISFLPITALCLTAVPLPSLIELRIIDQFTRAVVATSVAILPLIGIPAEANGFTIWSMAESVNVSEACSGIRSLQSLIMISVFSGELFHLSLPQRIFIVAVGGVLAFSINTARAIILSIIRFSHGNEAFDQWHDLVGHVTFLTSGLLLLGIALWIDRARLRPASVRTIGAQRTLD